MVWLYSMPYFIPDSYHRLMPYVDPYILPATQCSLTGQYQTSGHSAKFQMVKSLEETEHFLGCRLLNVLV